MDQTKVVSVNRADCCGFESTAFPIPEIGSKIQRINEITIQEKIQSSRD